MKQKRLLVLILMCMIPVLCIMQASAADLYIQAPKTGNTAFDTILQQQANIITGDLNTKYFDNFKSQTDFARAFGNANAVASYAGSNQSFQNYDLFSIMVGFAGGFALPTSLDQTSHMGSELNSVKNGDVYIGGSAALALNVGLKVPFLFDNLYINGKFGYIDQKFGSDFRVQQFLIGFGANYAYIQDISVLGGLARWRGLSLGTGLIYNQSSYTVNVPLSDHAPVTVNDGSGNVGILNVTDIYGNFSIKSASLTIPFDVTTSVQVLWLFNAGIGAGVDLNIPTASVGAGASANVSYSKTTGLSQQSAGYATFGQTSESKLKFFDVVSPKVMASIGLNISIVKIDMPFIYYPLSKTFALGICGGVVW